jgi:hypothetical protein
MQVQNIIRARFRRSIAELHPILKRRLTPTQLDQVNEAFSIAAEVFFDSLDDILEGKQPDFVLDALTEDDIDDLLELEPYDDAT